MDGPLFAHLGNPFSGWGTRSPGLNRLRKGGYGGTIPNFFNR